MSIVHGRSKIVAILEGKFVGVTRSSSVYMLSVMAILDPRIARQTSHVRKLLTATFQVGSILGLDCILDGAWDRIVNAKDRTLDELDFSCCISLQGVSSRSLSLSPCFS